MVGFIRAQFDRFGVVSIRVFGRDALEGVLSV